jgi:hypothetical protein
MGQIAPKLIILHKIGSSYLSLGTYTVDWISCSQVLKIDPKKPPNASQSHFEGLPVTLHT